MYKLKNNLRLFLLPFSDSKSVNVSFYVKAGSRFETAKNNGIAHFLEHMAFKSTEKFASEYEMAKFVEGFGGDWNASTSAEVINYYIRAEASHIDDIFYVFDQMFRHPLFKKEDIEKEKGVIIEEINMYYDVPQYKVSILADQLMWPNHPLGRFTAGTKETVSAFVREDFLSYEKSLFSPSNIVIGVSGKFEEKKIMGLIEQYFGSMKDRPVIAFEEAKATQKEPSVVVETRESEQAHMLLGFRGISRHDKRKFALNLASMILGVGASSRLFTKIRGEMGLAYYISAYSENLMDTGAFVIPAGLNTASCVKGINEILKELKAFKNGAVSKEELKKSKEHLKGLLALRLEEHRKLNGFLCEQEILGEKVLTYEEVVKEIEKVSVDDVVAVASDVFVNDKLNLAVVGKVSEKEVKGVAVLD